MTQEHDYYRCPSRKLRADDGSKAANTAPLQTRGASVRKIWVRHCRQPFVSSKAQGKWAAINFSAAWNFDPSKSSSYSRGWQR